VTAASFLWGRRIVVTNFPVLRAALIQPRCAPEARQPAKAVRQQSGM